MLFGKRWQEPLARKLGVSGKTMRRWIAREFVVPISAMNRLVDVLVMDFELLRQKSVEVDRGCCELVTKLLGCREELKEPA